MFLIRSFSKCSILRLRHVGLANYTGSRSILWTYRLSPSVCSQLGACIAISLQTVCRNARTTHLMLVASIKTFVFYLINLIIVTAVTACFLGQFCGVLFSCPVSPPPPFPSPVPSQCVCLWAWSLQQRDAPAIQLLINCLHISLVFSSLRCQIVPSSTSVSPALSQVSDHAFLISDVTFSCLCSTLFSARLTCRCLLHWLHLLTWVSCTFL